MKHNLRKRILVLATILTMLICVPTVNSCATEVPKEDPIQTIVQNMTLRQKIAQCLMMDFRKWNDAEGEAQNMTRLAPEVKTILEEYQFGAVILFAENIQKTGDTVALTKEMQDAATAKGGLPLLIATDQEGGIVYRLGSGTALPGNMALAATGDSNNAMLAGEIDLTTTELSVAHAYVQSGDMRILGTMTEERLADYGDYPTCRELGYDCVGGSFQGMFCPNGVDDETKANLEALLTDCYNSDAYQTYCKNAGMVPAYLDHEGWEAFLKEDLETTTALMKDLGLAK